MTKDHWKAACLVAASALILTNAAGHYTRRTLETRIAELERALAAKDATPEPLPAPAPAPAPVRRLPAVTAVPAPAEEDANTRCIGGQLFRKTGNAWEQLHQGC